jgi:hypothetical protein
MTRQVTAVTGPAPAGDSGFGLTGHQPDSGRTARHDEPGTPCRGWCWIRASFLLPSLNDRQRACPSCPPPVRWSGKPRSAGFLTRQGGVQSGCTVVQAGCRWAVGPRSQAIRARGSGCRAVPARPDRRRHVPAQGGSARARLAIAAWIVLVAVSLADHAVDISAGIERRQVPGSLISDYGRAAFRAHPSSGAPPAPPAGPRDRSW